MKNKFFCLHAHFRGQAVENPWTGNWERDPSARPWHDLNHRSAAGLFLVRPPASRRAASDRAESFLDCYERIGFDVSPRLLDWLDAFFPELPAALAEADRRSARNFGEGSALAHPWPHAILPLLSARDKRSAIRWGLDYFEHRFKRKAAGMWLPEAAADVDTLSALCAAGVSFTVLAPSQAHAFRKESIGKWEPANANSLDTSVPYEWLAPDGGSLAVFFSSPRLSALLTEGMGAPGEFAAAVDAELPSGKGSALASCAFDWERHCRRHADAPGRVAEFLSSVHKSGRWALSNFASFLRDGRPSYEISIISPSSSSCPHGLERWAGECSCRAGSDPRRPVKWRPALRAAASLLEERVTAAYDREAAALFADPAAAFEAAGRALACPDPHEARRFLASAFGRQPRPAEARAAMGLLHMQRARLLSLDSDAWFFDDLKGPAARGALLWAAAACDAAGGFGENPSEAFAAALEAGEKGAGGDFLSAAAGSRFGPPQAACEKALFLAAGLPQPPRQGKFHILVNYEDRFEKDGSRFHAACLRVEDRDTLANGEFAALAVIPPGEAAFCLAAPAPDPAGAAALLSGLPGARSAREVLEAAGRKLGVRLSARDLPGDAGWLAAAAGLAGGVPSADEKAWLAELRRLSPARLQDPSLPALLSRLSAGAGAPPPSAHEACRQAVAHLRLLLERSDPAAAFASAWIALFASPPFTAHSRQLRAALAERLEGKPRPEETRPFREAFSSLLEEAGLKDAYDIKKTQA
ncbi:MAG: DUF3536 domain-containing protein [Elusimicrobiales bacterium]|jgi:hypothetical protein|nr:DUF3536 domain-containing protein [Elusimicrobiales bacterium]